MVVIKEIHERRDIKKFIAFANKLYKHNPYYVPDMFSSQVADYDREKNPAFEYCDAKCFLAFRENKIVGRIAAIYNTRSNEKYAENQMRFSHADYIDDKEVVDALFSAVEAWGREKGCTSIHGPLGFSDMDKEGLLVEGFDKLSQFYVYYNYPYYMEHMERMGFVKDVDWVEYRISLPALNDERLLKLDRLASAVERRMKLVPVPLTDRKSIKPHIEDVFKLYNEAYLALFGMVALTPLQVEKYVDEFLPIVDGRTTAMLRNDKGELVAFGVAAPSLSHAQQKSRGRLFPFGWFHMLRALKGKNDTLDLFLIAVRPDLQGTGINAVLINRLLKFAIEDGVKYAETGPELEENKNVQSQWRYFDTEQNKRRRCYIKQI